MRAEHVQRPEAAAAEERLRIVVLGLSITSSWGNGHATTWRALLRGLAERGHAVRFLERDVPWYAANRDLPRPGFCALALYASLEELRDAHADAVREADLVLLGSYVPEGVAVAEWVLAEARGLVAFYDIDTPVTLARLARGDHEYLHPRLIPRFDLYLSFAAGPVLRRLERELGARRARPLLCCVDPERHRPATSEEGEEGPGCDLDLGYLGTHSPDRRPALGRLLLEPARRWPEGRFAVAGPGYPPDLVWPANVAREEHLAPDEHARFYGRQRFTLNLTRAEMTASGHAPSVRLFEAAACGTPVVSDAWPGLQQLFQPGREILLAASADDVLRIVRALPEGRRQRIARAARERVLSEHTAARRAAELEGEIRAARRARRAPA